MLKRPLFTVAVTAVFACFFAVNLSANTILPILITFALAAGVLLLLRRRVAVAKSLALVLLTAVLAASYTLFTLSHAVAPVASLAGQTADITAEVTAPPTTFDTYVLIPVRFTSVDLTDAPQEFDGYLYSDDGYALGTGDRITGTVCFKAVSDYRAEQYYSAGKYITATLTATESVTRAEDGFSLTRLIADIRAYLKEFYSKNLNEPEAAFLQGVTLNDKSGFTDEMYSNFSRSGISHIVAVSGMHLTILCGAMRVLLRKIRLPERVAALLMIPFVLFIIAVVGFPISAIRAGIMVIITLIGSVFFKRSDALTSLGVAALLILAFQPLAVLSLSFQLSFAATLGLILLANPIDRVLCARTANWRFFGRVVAFISPYFSVSLAASIFTLPIAALQFGYIPLIAPLTNLCLLFTVSLAMIFGILAAVLAPLTFLSMPCLLVAGLSSKYILAVAKFFANLSFATLSFESVGMKLALAGGILLIAIAILKNANRRNIFVASLLCVILLAGTTFADRIIARNTVEIRVFQSETGICAAVSRGREVMLIGTGDRYSMFDANDYLLLRGGRRFGYVLLPDTSETFAKAWNPLIHTTEYDMILAQGDGAYESVFLSPEIDAVRDPVDTLTPFEDVTVQMLRTEDGNGALVSVFDKTILIAEQNLPDRSADILICTTPNTEGIDNFETVIIAGRGDVAAMNAATIQNDTNAYIVDDATLRLRFYKDHYTLGRTT